MDLLCPSVALVSVVQCAVGSLNVTPLALYVYEYNTNGSLPFILFDVLSPMSRRGRW